MSSRKQNYPNSTWFDEDDPEVEHVPVEEDTMLATKDEPKTKRKRKAKQDDEDHATL